MDLIIQNRVIRGDLKNLLYKIKVDSGKNYFKDIEEDGKNLRITCPYHKNGRESKPSCYIYRNRKDPNIQWGVTHCFSCGKKVSLPQLVSDCLNVPLERGNQWLVDNFGGEETDLNIPPELELKQRSDAKKLDESVLDKYNFYHPYMWERKLTKEVVDKFKVGYDKEEDSLTFPVWDINNNLVLITKRSTKTKHFHIDKNGEKPLYLLNFVRDFNLSKCIITEAQIDALTAWGYGFPCIATMGSPSQEQIDILNKSGIRVLITMFDNDDAGRSFTNTINKKVKPEILVINAPIEGNKKDINDLSKEDFWKILKKVGINS